MDEKTYLVVLRNNITGEVSVQEETGNAYDADYMGRDMLADAMAGEEGTQNFSVTIAKIITHAQTIKTIYEKEDE